MVDTSLTGISLVIVGVLLIVVGASTVVAGMGKLQAAQAWEPPEQTATCVTTYQGMDYEEFTRKYANATSDEERRNLKSRLEESMTQTCTTPSPPENPYAGGGTDVLLGFVLSVTGGVALYYGAQQ